MILCEKDQKTSHYPPARHMRHSIPFVAPTPSAIPHHACPAEPFSSKPPGLGSCSIPSAWRAILPISLPRALLLILPDSAQMAPPPESLL